MTQEWFESADLEKKSPQTKSEIQPDEPETSETVETEPQVSEETSVSPKELETHEEEAPEMIEEAQTKEEGEGKAEEEHIYAENIKVHGKVELDSHNDLRLFLSKAEFDRINLDLSSQHGGIYRKAQREHPRQKENGLANPYKTDKADVKDMLIIKANQDIYLPKEEEYSAPPSNH